VQSIGWVSIFDMFICLQWRSNIHPSILLTVPFPRMTSVHVAETGLLCCQNLVVVLIHLPLIDLRTLLIHPQLLLQFCDLDLKITATVSWFGAKNQSGFDLSVVP
jgi:hypothetical protein